MDVNLAQKVNALPIHTSTSKEPEGISIDALLERVEEFHRRQQLETLEKLTRENSLLQQQIVRYQESSSQTINLLQEVHNIVALIQDARGRCRHKELAADRDWLAFWGIRDEPTDGSGYYPADWI